MEEVKKRLSLSGLRTYTMVFALLVIWGIFQYETSGAFLTRP